MRQSTSFSIVPYQDQYKNEILSVWEKSVAATHHFIKPHDFELLKGMLHTLDFNLFRLFCLRTQSQIIGFIGMHEDKIEMLFLHPDYLGRGLGKSLVHFAIRHLHIDKVDVNEQNTPALQFYLKMGFTPFERTETDGQGLPYPLLRMKLRSKQLAFVKSILAKSIPFSNHEI